MNAKPGHWTYAEGSNRVTMFADYIFHLFSADWFPSAFKVCISQEK